MGLESDGACYALLCCMLSVFILSLLKRTPVQIAHVLFVTSQGHKCSASMWKSYGADSCIQEVFECVAHPKALTIKAAFAIYEAGTPGYTQTFAIRVRGSRARYTDMQACQ